MRIVFVAQEDAATRDKAKQSMPWAAKIVKVAGGWKGFESIEEYLSWKKAK